MNQQCRVVAAEPRDRYAVPCAECQGSGEVSYAMRWSGEVFGGEWLSERCPVCLGACETVCCEFCDKPIANNRCDDCCILFVEHLGEGSVAL